MKLSIFCSTEYCYADCHYVEYRDYLNVMLSVVAPSPVLLNAILANVVTPVVGKDVKTSDGRRTSVCPFAKWRLKFEWGAGIIILTA
jgi:hypothetical protein